MPKIIKMGSWERVDLCVSCGAVVDPHHSKVCKHCGHVGKHILAEVITTSRRRVTTFIPNWFQRLKGMMTESYWEYSGKTPDGNEIDNNIGVGSACFVPINSLVATTAASISIF